MLSADPQLDLRSGFAPQFAGHRHELADPRLVEDLEWILFVDAQIHVLFEEPTGVIA